MTDLRSSSLIERHLRNDPVKRGRKYRQTITPVIGICIVKQESNFVFMSKLWSLYK